MPDMPLTLYFSGITEVLYTVLPSPSRMATLYSAVASAALPRKRLSSSRSMTVARPLAESPRPLGK